MCKSQIRKSKLNFVSPEFLRILTLRFAAFVKKEPIYMDDAIGGGS